VWRIRANTTRFLIGFVGERSGKALGSARKQRKRRAESDALLMGLSAHPMQCLQVKLIGGLGGDELHRRPRHRLGNCLGVTEVILLSLEYGRTYFAGISRASWPSALSLRLR
jgi:hypothetical protein